MAILLLLLSECYDYRHIIPNIPLTHPFKTTSRHSRFRIQGICKRCPRNKGVLVLISCRMFPSHQVSLWRISGTIDLRILQLGGVKIAFTWQKPGTLLIILQCSLDPTTKSHLAEYQRWLGLRSCFRLLEGSRTRIYVISLTDWASCFYYVTATNVTQLL